MNEQIEKLAVQAFSFASETDDSDESDANWWNAYNEKFAELIIEECVKFVPSATQSNAILKYFGVE